MKCPNCKSEIEPVNVNVQTDIAKCMNCGNVFRISVNLPDIHAAFDLNETPRGTWYHESLEETTVGASTRHWVAFILVPFMCVWSGGSLFGIYGSQILKGEFSPLMSLFGIPFLLGSVFFWSFALMAIWGKVEITFNNTEGKIFTGVGKVGFTRYFRWKDVMRITEGVTNFRYPGNQGGQIVFDGKSRISFGSGLNEERKYYLLMALRKMHSKILSKTIRS